MGGDQLLASDVLAAGEPSWSAKASSMWARLWAGMCQRYADYQRRGVAAAMYAVLSKLTDEELANRGLARADRLVVYSPTKEARRVLQAAGIDKIIPIAADEAAAAAAC